MQQFAERIICASCEYDPNINISYNSMNVIGGPSNFPLSNTDQLDSYLLNLYGDWNMLAPSYAPEFGLDNIPAVDNPPIDAFMVVSFEEFVYPSGIEVYETMNPGGVCRIWAFTESHEWVLLWDKRVDAVCDDERNAGLSEARIFVPVIRIINHRTRVIRLEFNTRHLNYIYAMDAIMLKSDIKDPRKFPRQALEEPLQQGPSIAILPYEMLYKIVTYLDLKSLRSLEQVSGSFRNVVRDPRLYKEVNLRPYWMDVDSKLLNWLKDRCFNIRKLDLSWCGLFQMFKKPELQSFLLDHGRSLTHLRLNSIGFSDPTHFGISYYTNLTELCLQNAHVTDVLNLDIELTKLTRLDLSSAFIAPSSLISLLRRNQGLQHLNLSCCLLDSFRLTQTIGQFNRQLISLNLYKTRLCPEEDLIPLTNCTKLQELNLGYANNECVQESDLSRLIEACQDLRKLVLACFRVVHNNNIFAIAQHCRALEYLDLMGCITATGESINAIFIGCSSLRFLDINHCWNITDEWITDWKGRYPNVAIQYFNF
ncbi:F-box/LRR-repeat protein 4-like [Anopheles marshallii]|uniref:F-box/LRR-repeat protein 4-like n=1 Tax=Anopheles marshallii TaxID=1521116 RepID=UPI00237C3B7C|nr:F-box/LRR-repeat protein 4-like [Anopheles marshallii]